MAITLNYGDIGFDIAINVGAILFTVAMFSLCYIIKTITSME